MSPDNSNRPQPCKHGMLNHCNMLVLRCNVRGCNNELLPNDTENGIIRGDGLCEMHRAVARLFPAQYSGR